MNDRVLEFAKRGHVCEDVLKAVRVLKQNKFSLGIQMMAGLPGDTTLSFLNSVKKIISLQPDFVRIYPLLILKQTGLAKLYEQGGYRPLSLHKAITLTRKAYTSFTENKIRVIRMGLQPSGELEKNLVAGPYHPSFGELVISRNFFVIARKILCEAGSRSVEITISDRDYSAFVGNKKENLKRLKTLFPHNNFHLSSDPKVKRGHVHHAFC